MRYAHLFEDYKKKAVQLLDSPQEETCHKVVTKKIADEGSKRLSV